MGANRNWIAADDAQPRQAGFGKYDHLAEKPCSVAECEYNKLQTNSRQRMLQMIPHENTKSPPELYGSFWFDDLDCQITGTGGYQD